MGDAEIIAGLGTRATWVRGAPDLLQRAASPDEKALAATIGGGAQLRDVLAGCGLPEAKAIAVLLGMRLRGLVIPMSPPPGGSAPRPLPRQPTGAGGPVPGPLPRQQAGGGLGHGPLPRQQTGVGQTGAHPPARPATVPRQPRAVDAAALNEPVDLEEARKKEILDLEARLDSDDFFTLLGVPLGAPAADCKKAYYELTKRFHPDRYFGKALGSYKARIDAIFRKLTEAQSTVSDPARRGEYLNEHPELLASNLDEPGESPVDPQLAAQRAAERRARLARHPYLAKQGKVHELLSRAKVAVDGGEYAKAIADLTLASQMEPKNREISDLLARAKKGSDKRRAAEEFKAATEAETMNDMVTALSRYRTAVSLDPENVDVVYRAGRALAAHGGDSELKEAHTLLRKATELAPSKVDYHLVFAKVLLRAGMEKNAQREYEAVLKLDPENATAKEQARKLKWKF
ncbi:MAG TPA: DnaJ domain-containing protein [Myxococcales bacterium]